MIDEKKAKMDEIEADVDEWYNERAGIYEYMANLTRNEAEARARVDAEIRRADLIAAWQRSIDEWLAP